jgi:hypothetical protein
MGTWQWILSILGFVGLLHSCGDVSSPVPDHSDEFDSTPVVTAPEPGAVIPPSANPSTPPQPDGDPPEEIDPSPSPDPGLEVNLPSPPNRDEVCGDAVERNSCESCACTHCADWIRTCYEDSNCVAVMECVSRTDCDENTCLQECASEINAAGGILGAAAEAAVALGECRDMNCANEC